MKISLLFSSNAMALFAAAFLLLGLSGVQAQTLTWDAAPGTPLVQNGSGTWNTTGNNWIDSVSGNNVVWGNTGLEIAQFGSTSPVNPSAVTIASSMNLKGINFLSLGASTPVSGQQYALNGSVAGTVLNFGNDGVVQFADNASGGSQFINFGSNLQFQGNNLTFQKSAGTAVNFISMGSINNPNLTGTLTVGSYIYLGFSANAALSNLSRIVVQDNGNLVLSGTNVTYTTPMTLSGVNSAYGAIRVTGTNLTLSGGITLAANSAIAMFQSNTGLVFSAPITDGGNKFGFQLFSLTKSDGTVTFTAANTYSGNTTLGRNTGGYTGGINILDFAATGAPQQDILYNGVATPGGLDFIGSNIGTSVLKLNGKAVTTNTQRLGNVSVTGFRSVIELAPGVGGAIDLSLGTITRTGTAMIAFTAPAGSTITTTSPDGILGPWATLTKSATSSSWASVTGGVLTSFTGDLLQESGIAINALASYTATGHLSITAASTGAVTTGGTDVTVGSVSMTDSTTARVLDIGSGNTLRMGATGGIQLTGGGKDFTVGVAGAAGTLTGAAATSQLWLTNLSATGALTINSVIANNGSGVLSLSMNGSGNVVLAGANTYTGATQIAAGSVDARNSGAFGTSAGGVTILNGAALRLSNNITLTDAMTITGYGLTTEGVIRNISGDNALNGTVTLINPSRINSDSGTLIFGKDLAATAVNITGSFNLNIGGSGNTTVVGRISTATGIITKDGTGILTLQGSNIYTSATTLTEGTLHLDFSPASAPLTNILYNGSTTGIMAQGGNTTLNVTGKSGASVSQVFGSYTLGAGYSTINLTQNGATSLILNLGAITRTAGGILGFTLPTAGAISTTSGTDNAILSGAGGVTYATITTSDWAATKPSASGVTGLRDIVGLSSITNGYTNSSATSLTGNADIAASITTTTLSLADTAIASLRFNQPQATTITQDTAGRILTVGGILVTPAVGANETLISTSVIRPAGASGDLVIFQNNIAAPLRITGKINLGTAAGSGLTKTGPGTLILESNTVYATGNYTGATRIQDGTLHLAAAAGATGIIINPIYSSTTFVFGAGTTSGKLILGSTAGPVYQYGGLKIEGTGAGNTIVGGSASLSYFLQSVGSSDFRLGMIGGNGTNEDNIRVYANTGTLTLGPANTYKGETIILQNTLEVMTLANTGFASSLGKGNYNSATHIIQLSSATTSLIGSNAVGTLRYIGSTDSVTNRPVSLVNSGTTATITFITGNIENTGTGTVKFTSAFTSTGTNSNQRTLRLGGTNTGENEIVSMSDNSTVTTLPSPGVKLEKYGTGTWILTGNSTYTGTTTVSNGILQLGKGGTAGNVGEGDILLTATTAVLATNRSGIFNLDNIISGSGTVRINNALTGTTILTNDANSYTGPTVVNSGTLQIESLSGSAVLGSGSVTVNAGAKLSGYGKIAPSINNSVILSGGTLSVGDSTTGAEEIGTLIISTSGTGALRFEGASVVSLELLFGAGMGNNTTSAGSVTSDLLTIIGNVDFGTNTKLQVLTSQQPDDYLAGDSWKLFDWSGLGTRTGTFAQLELPTLAEGLYWNTNSLYTTGVLVVNVVPEPSRLLLMVLATAIMVFRRRKNSSQ